MGRASSGAFGQQIFQLTELVYHLHEVVHCLWRVKHELTDNGTLGFKSQLEGRSGYLLVAVIDLIEHLPVAVDILPESFLRTLPQPYEGVNLFLGLVSRHEPSQKGSLKVPKAPD